MGGIWEKTAEIPRLRTLICALSDSEQSDNSGEECLLDMTDQQPWMCRPTGPWRSLLVIGLADQWEVLSLQSH